MAKIPSKKAGFSTAGTEKALQGGSGETHKGGGVKTFSSTLEGGVINKLTKKNPPNGLK